MLPEFEAREELDDRRGWKSPRPDRSPVERVSALEMAEVVVAPGGKPAHQVGAVGGALVGRLPTVQATDVEDEIKRLGRLRRGKHIALLEVDLGTGGLASRAPFPARGQ